MATYKLLAGQHVEKDAEGNRKKYKAGQYVSSKLDLERRHGTRKFRKISDDDVAPAVAKLDDPTQPKAKRQPPVNDALDDMTVEQLKQLAEDDEIDLSGATRKADIIQKIRDNR
jgi:hypothetical protein